MLPDFGAMYSVSAELSATDLSFLLYQETVAWTKVEIPTDVLFRSDGLPSQSAYVNPCSFTPSDRLYHNPYWDVPLRYLKTCFTAFQNILVG